MRTKETSVERPNRLPYVTCDLGEAGRFIFRLPSPGRAQKLMEAYSSVDQSDMAAVERSAGELIKECWADPHYDLCEAEGGAVFRELWDDGWSFGLILGLVAALVDQMSQAFLSEADVKETVAFFGKTPGSTTSGN